MGTGWGIPGWVPGRVIPVPSTLLGERSHTSEAGPVGPCRGPEWVGVGARANGGGDGSQDHPAGPVSQHAGLPVLGPSECRLLAIWARFDLIS